MMSRSVMACSDVIGIIRTRNGFEDGGVFMPLEAAQKFFHKEGSSVITIKLRTRKMPERSRRKYTSATPISSRLKMQNSPVPIRSSRF